MPEAGPLTLIQLVAVNAVMAVGAILQGSVGFGIGLFSAPILILLDPGLIPAPILLTAGWLTFALAYRERHAIRYPDLRWAIAGRIVGSAGAATFLALVPERVMIVGFGALIMVSVVLSFSGLALSPTRGHLVGAGLLSGLLGTVAAVGGSPMGLVYQNESGARIRGTLSAFFLAGVVISLIALGMVGRFGLREVRLAAAMTPGTLVGLYVSRHFALALDKGHMKKAVLVVSGVTGIVVVLREML